MSDSIREKFAAFGGEVSRKMNSVGDKMKELFQGTSPADKLVEDATSEKNGWSPDWSKNLEICDIVNAEGVSSQEVVKAIKKRLNGKGSAVQLLALVLLETCVKNCDKMFAEVASEKVLDELVKIVDDHQTSSQNREKVLRMIESWGEATEELRYLPVFEETYKSLRSRGVQFPGRDEESLAPIFTPPQSVPLRAQPPLTSVSSDPKEVFDVARNITELLSTVLTSAPKMEVLKDDLTTALVEQCRQTQANVQRLIESSGDNESLVFEGLQVNDELQRVLKKYEELSAGQTPQPEPATAPAFVVDEESNEESLVRARPKQGDTSMDQLDELVFGKGSGPSRKTDDFIQF